MNAQKYKEHEEATADIHKKLEELGVSIQAQFVPRKYTNLTDAKLNWHVTLLINGAPCLSTEYSAGIGHIEGYKHPINGRFSLDEAHAIVNVCNGRCNQNIMERLPRYKRPDLDHADVIYCLVQDASAIDYPNFESWASEYGYDEDSRLAEKIYRQCLDIGLKMRSSLGDEKLTRLRELFENY